MWRSRQRNEVLRLFGRRALPLVLILLVGGALFSVLGVYKKERDSAALKWQNQVRLADLEKRQEQLKADIADLKTARGIEEELRKQYALAALGEKMIIIVEPPTSAPVHATSSVFDTIGEWFSWW